MNRRMGMGLFLAAAMVIGGCATPAQRAARAEAKKQKQQLAAQQKQQKLAADQQKKQAEAQAKEAAHQQKLAADHVGIPILEEGIHRRDLFGHVDVRTGVAVHDVLQEARQKHLHALQLKTMTPDAWRNN